MTTQKVQLLDEPKTMEDVGTVVVDFFQRRVSTSDHGITDLSNQLNRHPESFHFPFAVKGMRSFAFRNFTFEAFTDALGSYLTMKTIDQETGKDIDSITFTETADLSDANITEFLKDALDSIQFAEIVVNPKF